MSYLADPEEIYRRSFAAIREEVDLTRFPAELHPLVLRLVHAGAMPDIADDLAWHGDPVASAREALNSGANILVDAEMVRHGIIARRLAAGTTVHCFLNDPQTPEISQKLKTTRSAAAVELWRAHLDGAVVSIGNAPTALFHLLEILAEENPPRPAALFAFPVGFIGAAESKSALVEQVKGIPFVTLRGRRGGSAYAAAAINALAGDGLEGTAS